MKFYALLFTILTSVSTAHAEEWAHKCTYKAEGLEEEFIKSGQIFHSVEACFDSIESLISIDVAAQMDCIFTVSGKKGSTSKGIIKTFDKPEAYKVHEKRSYGECKKKILYYLEAFFDTKDNTRVIVDRLDFQTTLPIKNNRLNKSLTMTAERTN